VRDMREELLSESAIQGVTKGYDVPAMSISRTEETGDLKLELPNGVKVKFNLRELRKENIDLAEAIGLVKQIVDNPDERPLDERFRDAKFEYQQDGYWEVGKGLALLIEKVYSEMAQQKATAIAA